MTIQIFIPNVLSSICQEKHDYLYFEKIFIDTLNKHTTKKIMTFRGIQKTIMKRSQLKNKANKTRNTIDVSD